MSGWTSSEAYWSAARSWAAANATRTRTRAKAAKEHIETRGQLQARVRNWESATRIVTTGTASDAPGIHVSPQLSAICGEMLARVAPALAEAYDRHLALLAFSAWRDWPVASGLSKSLLSLRYEQIGAEYFTGSITSQAPYTRYIQGQPFRTLIDAKGNATAAAIGNDAVAEIAAGAANV